MGADEIERLRADVEQLRGLINTELDRDGGGNRALLLATAKLLREKNARIEELEPPDWSR